jgi:enamine deaminase RidA (YjgF/YER057c/UK114 family)
VQVRPLWTLTVHRSTKVTCAVRSAWLDNLEAVLTGAGMTFANIVRLNIYTTDVDEALTHYEVLRTRLGQAS